MTPQASGAACALSFPVVRCKQRRRLTLASFLFTLVTLLPLSVQAQSFVYVNNQDVANTVVAFSVSSSGTLSAIAGSPFATGGAGSMLSCYGLDRITANAANHLLFVSNGGDQTISVLMIDPVTGALTPAPGSPFASGLTLDSCGGISLAATPDGSFLMASSNGQIKTFNVAASGVLTPAATSTNCCSPNVGMKVSPNGKLLAVSNETSVSVFTINADGSLTQTAGSPFPRGGTGLLSSVEFTCASDHLYGSEASFGTSSIVDAWLSDPGGILTPMTKSPFNAPGTDSSTVALSPDNSLLFANNQLSNKISSFTINADGSLTSIGSFGGVGTVHVPAGLALDASGNFLFAADDSFGIAVYKISATGALTGTGDLAINRAGSIQGVAAYPPKSCSSADLALTATAAPATVDAGSNVTYTISITNNGPDRTSATVVDNLPSGATFVSCASTGSGVCTQTLPNPHTISFGSLASGETETITLVAQASTTLLNGASLSNTVTIGNKSAVDPNLVNNSATATVTINAPASPTTLTVSPATGTYGGLAILTATLRKNSNGTTVAGKPVSFFLNGAPAGSAMTNGVGQAIFTVSIAGIPLGAYSGTVTASFAGDPLFTSSNGSASLTVTKAVLTVIGSSAVRTYGDPNPAFTYGISGFMNGDSAAVVSGTTTCTSPTDVTTPVGRYPITCDLGSFSAANYTFTVLPGTLTITPAPLTVAADNVTRIYGDLNPAFAGTITGLKNGDNITPLFFSNASALSPVGTYPILANYNDPAGRLSNYTPVISGTLTITVASLTVTADNATRVYGDPNPVFTGAITGIRNGDKITATYASPASATSPVGTYLIIPTLADPNARLSNYSVTVNNGTLAVTPAALTVTAADAERLYGDPNPVFAGSIVGIKNGDAITATYSSPASLTSAIGTYPIIPALLDPTGKLSNYAVTIVNGVLTINPAPLSVSASSTNRNYGSPNPAFTGVITGLKNADPITPNFSTTATIASPVGAYPITFASFNDPAGKLSNYTLAATTNGILTIRPASLTITGFNGTRFYGDPNPAPAISGIKNGDPVSAGYDATAPGPTAAAGGTFTLVPLVNPTPVLSNYTVTIQNGKVTINKAPLAVVAGNLSRPYGSANPALAGTITGVKNGENIAAAFSTSATQTSNVGTFAITATAVFSPTALAVNYSLTTTSGTLTITAVPLTIAANNQTIILGGLVSPSATYTGFVLEQSPANLSGTLSCNASAGTGNVGSSTLNCSGLSSTNYSLSFVPGTATVIYQVAGVSCTNGPGHVILAPISTAGTTTFARATTPTIAVQFRVCDSKGTSVSASGVVSSFVLTSVNGVGSSTPAPQGGPFAFVGGTLANGAGSAGWQFNLSTANLSAGNTYTYRINLNDGTSISFQFTLQ